jgi:hypothetical protein
MNNQLLQADLTKTTTASKKRLVARIWVALGNAPGNNDHLKSYEEFRARWTKQPFAILHSTFDYILAPQYRAKKLG